MRLLLAIVVGGLYAAGFYMMLRRGIVRLVIGLALISNAANLLIFTSGGLTRVQAPIIPEGATTALPLSADPVPQALILTAIVISFGVLAFALVLLSRVYGVCRTDDCDDLRYENE